MIQLLRRRFATRNSTLSLAKCSKPPDIPSRFTELGSSVSEDDLGLAAVSSPRALDRRITLNPLWFSPMGVRDNTPVVGTSRSPLLI